MDCKYAPPPLVLLAHHADGRDAPAALLIHCVCAVAGPLDPNSAWCPSTLDRHFTLVHRKAEEGEEEETEKDEEEMAFLEPEEAEEVEKVAAAVRGGGSGSSACYARGQ